MADFSVLQGRSWSTMHVMDYNPFQNLSGPGNTPNMCMHAKLKVISAR